MHSSTDSSTKTVNDYVNLIETVARVEYNRLSTSAHLIDYSELVNIGAVAVHIILTTHKKNSHNVSYLSTAIKWAIRNELRRRYKWYTLRYQSQKEESDSEGQDGFINPDQGKIREAIYETILSIDDITNAENPIQIKDSALTPEENLEFNELKRSITNAMKYLPPREKMVLEYRFFKGRKIKDIAEELCISSSRVTRIIQSGLDKVKNRLQKQGLI